MLADHQLMTLAEIWRHSLEQIVISLMVADFSDSKKFVLTYLEAV